MRSRRRDAEMVRQVPLQWPGAIPRLRPVDCSATPSYSMKWRSRADHGQKHETGDWMHSELDDRRPITEAAEPNMHSSPILLHKGRDPENGVVPEAQTNPNGTVKSCHASVAMGFTSIVL